MGMTTAAHHDQSATAAYRGFPLSLGMSPYANHHLHQSRSQESPYDASISAACSKIYDGAYNKDCAKNAATGAGSGGSTETNGYKDVWNTSSSGSTGQNASVPVRPSACTPDSRVGGYLDAAGGSPASRGGSGGVSGSAWNANCSITGASTQAATTALHQPSNHTFYPWMAIAG
uniref:Ultrabithorax n=3 Tax=Lutzomyia longipalpis TaxID=7200 RepID=A0A1B0CWG8_LUTLO